MTLRILPAPQAAIHHRGNEAARQEARQPWHQLVVHAWHHNRAPAHQTAVPLARHILGGAVEAARVMHIENAGTRLEFRRYRPGAERRDADALGAKLPPQPDAE